MKRMKRRKRKRNRKVNCQNQKKMMVRMQVMIKKVEMMAKEKGKEMINKD